MLLLQWWLALGLSWADASAAAVIRPCLYDACHQIVCVVVMSRSGSRSVRPGECAAFLSENVMYEYTYEPFHLIY